MSLDLLTQYYDFKKGEINIENLKSEIGNYYDSSDTFLIEPNETHLINRLFHDVLSNNDIDSIDDINDEISDIVDVIADNIDYVVDFSSLDPETQRQIVKNIYIIDREIDDIPEQLNDFLLAKLSSSLPENIDDFVSLGNYYNSFDSDDVDDLRIKNRIAESIPSNFLLDEIKEENDVDAFRVLLKLNKYSISNDNIIELTGKPDLLNILFEERFATPEGIANLTDMFKQINATSRGAEARQLFEDNSNVLDANLLNLARETLKSQQEINLGEEAKAIINSLQSEKNNLIIRKSKIEKDLPNENKSDYFMGNEVKFYGVVGAIIAGMSLILGGGPLVALAIAGSFTAFGESVAMDRYFNDKETKVPKVKDLAEKIDLIDEKIIEKSSFLTENEKNQILGNLSAPAHVNSRQTSGLGI
ncbi:MAG: hypothetical protein ISQ32_03490 [Rickettsiales bacterium]|nr:hypothetical protein [Rickettsiales bacterium]